MDSLHSLVYFAGTGYLERINQSHCIVSSLVSIRGMRKKLDTSIFTAVNKETTIRWEISSQGQSSATVRHIWPHFYHQRIRLARKPVFTFYARSTLISNVIVNHYRTNSGRARWKTKINCNNLLAECVDLFLSMYLASYFWREYHHNRKKVVGLHLSTENKRIKRTVWLWIVTPLMYPLSQWGLKKFAPANPIK